ncbi:hypothetical protein RIR_jg24239.t1 [Rhizophagus irregularis DAOM 181602=DAOM 197198]|nr:hypothetical protein RIR_jg24239.t1 [Rhizophagus irregularis DAOM 181602=DAOM 197198]
MPKLSVLAFLHVKLKENTPEPIILVLLHTFEKHIQYLKKHFVAAELQFLSHVIGKKGGKPDSEKVDKMVNYPKSENCEKF